MSSVASTSHCSINLTAPPTVSVCSLCAAGSTQRVVGCAETMTAKKTPTDNLNMAALTRAVKAAKPGTGAIRRAIQAVIFDMSDRDFTRLIMACRNPKQWQKAIEIMEVMQGVPAGGGSSPKPNFFTYSAVISVCCKSRAVAEALRLLKEMKEASRDDPSLAPDSVVYRLVIAACAKAGRTESVIEIHDEMIRSSVEADDQTLVYVCSAMMAQRDLCAAADLMDILRHRGGAVNVELYNRFIAICGESGDLEMAVEMFVTMQMAGEDPDACSCHGVITAMEVRGAAELAVQLIRDMLRSGIEVGIQTYLSLLRLLVKCDRTDLLAGIARISGHDGGVEEMNA